MEITTLNKHDFKKYLLDNLADSKQEELIFWKKGIPLPIDLIYRIFDERGELIKLYLDHISAFNLFYFIEGKNGFDGAFEIDKLPSSTLSNFSTKLINLYRSYYFESNISRLTAALAERLFLLDYNFTEDDFYNALCHEGRKYKRFYLPSPVRDLINRQNPDVLRHIGVSNGDMFGNIVADELGVYRSGFSDAFSAIFNRLLDFILEQKSKNKAVLAASSRIKVAQFQDNHDTSYNVHFANIHDGSLWEPKYSNAKTNCVLNNRHPYFELIANKTGLQVLEDIAIHSALIESETLRDSASQVLESYRQELSRKLRIIAEKI